MFEFISIIIVFLCLVSVAYCYFKAKKFHKIITKNHENEAAAHRILMNLADALRMPDERNGLQKAVRVRQLNKEIISYAESVESAQLDEFVEDDRVVNIWIRKESRV